MTVTGTTLGSVHYFSPEQARGDEVTGASDVYALAIVLFEMLTGRRPFEGDSAAAVALKRLSEDAPTPTAIGHPVAPGLEAILMRALSREPAERYPRCRRLRRGAARLAARPGRRAGAGRRAPRRRRGRDDPAGRRADRLRPAARHAPGRPHAGRAAAAPRRPVRRPTRRGAAVVDLAARAAGRRSCSAPSASWRVQLLGGFGRAERVADADRRARHRARVRGRGADDAAHAAGRPRHRRRTRTARHSDDGRGGRRHPLRAGERRAGRRGQHAARLRLERPEEVQVPSLSGQT